MKKTLIISIIALIGSIQTIIAATNDWGHYYNLDINTVSIASGNDDSNGFMYFPTSAVRGAGNPDNIALQINVPVRGKVNVVYMNKQTYALLLSAKAAGKNIAFLAIQEQASGSGINDVGVVKYKVVNMQIDN